MYKSKLFRLTAAAIIKDEASYLEEWISYHRLIGVEHFFLFDNGSTDNTAAILEKYINNGLVTYLYWPLFPGQIDAYAYAIRVFGLTTEWMALIDVDEFISLKGSKNVLEVLDSFPKIDQLLVFWKMFGHSGYQDRPLGLVIENYDKCERELFNVCKCIVRPESVAEVFVHHCNTLTKATFNDSGRQIKENWQHSPSDISGQRISINHYFTRSYSEYTGKIQRGQVDGRSTKVLESFEKWNFTTFDKSLFLFADEVKAFINNVTNLPKQPFRYGQMSPISSISSSRNFVLFSQHLIEKMFDNLQLSNGIIGDAYDVVRYTFGTVSAINDTAKDGKFISLYDDQLKEWSLESKSELIGAFGPYSNKNYELVNGVWTSDSKTDLLVDGTDPQIKLHGPYGNSFGYIWCAFLINVPCPTKIDLFVQGLNHQLELVTQFRRVEARQAGLVFGLVMISAGSIMPQMIRLDPGIFPGRYSFIRCGVFRTK